MTLQLMPYETNFGSYTMTSVNIGMKVFGK